MGVGWGWGYDRSPSPSCAAVLAMFLKVQAAVMVLEMVENRKSKIQPHSSRCALSGCVQEMRAVYVVLVMADILTPPLAQPVKRFLG